MLPNLPAPLNFLDVITVIGQPKIKLYRNDHLIETTAVDTANLLIGTGVSSLASSADTRSLEIWSWHPTRRLVRFGDDFRLEGTYPDFTITYRNPEFDLDLRVRATDKVSHFVKLLGGLFDHWSLLCRVRRHGHLSRRHHGNLRSQHPRIRARRQGRPAVQVLHVPDHQHR